MPSDRLKQTIKVVFINELRMKEAGIDHHGLFKEFLSTLCSSIFQPNLNLFLPTPSNDGTVVPSTTSAITAAADGLDHLQVFEFCGKMLGKAVYEGITTDIPFAAFVYSKILGRHCFFEDLPTLEPVLYKSLTFLKKYTGDCADLGLTFSIDKAVFGKVETVEIKPGGLAIEVNNENRFEYIYLMADYKLNLVSIHVF